MSHWKGWHTLVSHVPQEPIRHLHRPSDAVWILTLSCLACGLGVWIPQRYRRCRRQRAEVTCAGVGKTCVIGAVLVVIAHNRGVCAGATAPAGILCAEAVVIAVGGHIEALAFCTLRWAQRSSWSIRRIRHRIRRHRRPCPRSRARTHRRCYRRPLGRPRSLRRYRRIRYRRTPCRRTGFTPTDLADLYGLRVHSAVQLLITAALRQRFADLSCAVGGVTLAINGRIAASDAGAEMS